MSRGSTVTAGKPDDEEDLDEGEEVGDDDNDDGEAETSDDDEDGEGEEGSDDGTSGVEETEDEESAAQINTSKIAAQATSCKGGKGHVHSASCADKDHGNHGKKRTVSEAAAAGPSEPDLESKEPKKAKNGAGLEDAVVEKTTGGVSAEATAAAAVAGGKEPVPEPVAAAAAGEKPVSDPVAAAAAEVLDPVTVAAAATGAMAVAAPVSVLTMQGGGPAGGCGSIDEVPLGLRLEIAICDLEPQGERTELGVDSSVVVFGKPGFSSFFPKFCKSD